MRWVVVWRIRPVPCRSQRVQRTLSGGTGPILILDKSAFQMFSAREHLCRSIHFFDNVTPILVTLQIARPDPGGK